MSIDTARVSSKAPIASNPLITRPSDSLTPTTPKPSGIVIDETTKHARRGGTCVPNAHLQPMVSAMVPPNVAPNPEPRPTTMLIYDR